jgi:hypothetical protein
MACFTYTHTVFKPTILIFKKSPMLTLVHTIFPIIWDFHARWWFSDLTITLFRESAWLVLCLTLPRVQGSQMVSFSDQKSHFGYIWRNLGWKMLLCILAISNILLPLSIFSGHLVIFIVIWYNFSALVYCTYKNLATLLEWSCVYGAGRYSALLHNKNDFPLNT